MEHDYYQILMVEPTVDANALLKAYLRQAGRFHPDRGGTHEQMLLINEAWQVLSDPELRSRYDAARASCSDQAKQETAATDAQRARHRAEQYPRQWAEFERWLDRTATDFSKATYGSHTQGFWHFPTVKNSYSGWAFIIAGGILGAALAVSIIEVPKRLSRDGIDKNQYYLGGGGAMIGAWVCAWLHRAISDSVKDKRAKATSPPNSARRPETDHTSSESETRILACENCGQKLRVPRMAAQMLVTCKTCMHKFWVAPDSGQSSPG